MPYPRPLADLRDEALGRRHKDDPALGTSGGPAGNKRLTAWAGLLLLVLILAELVTLLDVSGLISWHVVLGMLIVGLTVVKTASTSWRVVRYYSGHGPYRSAGPPLTPLRILGPLVVVTAVGLLASGVALIFLGPGSGQRPLVTVLGVGLDMLTLHQILFFAFGVAAGLHVIARLVPAVTLLAGRIQRARKVPGGGRRIAAVLLALGASAIVAILLLGPSASWRHDDDHDHHHRFRSAAVIESAQLPHSRDPLFLAQESAVRERSRGMGIGGWHG